MSSANEPQWGQRKSSNTTTCAGASAGPFRGCWSSARSAPCALTPVVPSLGTMAIAATTATAATSVTIMIRRRFMRACYRSGRPSDGRPARRRGPRDAPPADSPDVVVDAFERRQEGGHALLVDRLEALEPLPRRHRVVGRHVGPGRDHHAAIAGGDPLEVVESVEGRVVIVGRSVPEDHAPVLHVVEEALVLDDVVRTVRAPAASSAVCG